GLPFSVVTYDLDFPAVDSPGAIDLINEQPCSAILFSCKDCGRSDIGEQQANLDRFLLSSIGVGCSPECTQRDRTDSCKTDGLASPSGYAAYRLSERLPRFHFHHVPLPFLN